MKHLFLDSQIWLSLYDFSSDDLDQFSKLNELIDNDVSIYLTMQVREEVLRNRENKIKAALSKYKEIGGIQIPNLCKGYKEFSTFRDLSKAFTEGHKNLLSRIELDIESQSLHADKVIQDIFSKLTIIERTEEIVSRSIIRYEIGNPPGKDKSYGDAINWETLLEIVPKGEELFFVSADKDFRSVLNDNRLNQYLYDEWKLKKESDIHFYKSLTEFFNRHLKDIELKTENQKNQLVEAFTNSGSFAETHRIITKLSEHASWNDDQINALLKAASDNSQIYSIISDNDIKTFFCNILSGKVDQLFMNEELTWILDRLGFIRTGQSNPVDV